MPRCQKGTRRNKKTGNCTKVENNRARKRCPNGTRKTGLGEQCISKKDIMIRAFNDMHKEMKHIAYVVEEYFYNLHEEMTPKLLKNTKSKVATGLKRIQHINEKYARMLRKTPYTKHRVVEVHATELHKKIIDAIQKDDLTEAMKLKTTYVSDIYSYVEHNERVLAIPHIEEIPDWVPFF